MKKLFALLALLLPLLTMAQEELQGTWKFHPTYFMSQAKDMIDTERFVYALSNQSLVRLDKQTLEVEALTPANGLHDVLVRNIYYNYDKQYLLVVYANSNLDFIYEDGRIVNMSDVKDVVMNIVKTINDVNFVNNQVILATGYGLAIIDDNTLTVTEFRNYQTALSSVLLVGDATLVVQGSDVLRCTGSRELFSNFTDTVAVQAAARLRPIDESNIFIFGTNMLMRCALTDSAVVKTNIITNATPNNVQRTANGWLVNCRAGSCYYTISNTDFTVTKTTGNTSSLFSCNPNGDGTVWQIDGTGIHQKGVTTPAYRPGGMYIHDSSCRLWYCMYNNWDQKFYLTTADQKNGSFHDNVRNIKHIFSFDGENWTNATPAAIKTTDRLAKIAFIPGMPNSYFATDRSKKFYRVINGVVTGTFVNKDVAGLLKYGNSVSTEPGLLVDREGNLWMVSTTVSKQNKAVAMLPKAKVLADTVTYADWVQLDPTPFDLTYPQRQTFVESTTGVKAYCSGYQSNLINIWRTRPGSNDPTDYELKSTQKFVDQNGKAVEWHLNEVHVMAPDSTGNIWLGTYLGTFYFKADDAFNSDFRVTVPEVTDGDSGPYDIQTTSIAVDALNRKWIGTYENGLYVVSPDGTRVLNHFDVDNSGLPSSFVHEVSASLEKAVVITENGVVEFDMGDIEVVVDYTAVTAAPLFVEPDYTGFVTIGQVEPGGFVRITDRDGNTIREFTATGGQVAWDVCLEDGERVPTGVYNIYAGPSASQLPASPQARVKVVK